MKSNLLVSKKFIVILHINRDNSHPRPKGRGWKRKMVEKEKLKENKRLIKERLNLD